MRLVESARRVAPQSVAALAFLVGACGSRGDDSAAQAAPHEAVVRLGGETMGTTWSVLFVEAREASGESASASDLQAEIERELGRVDLVFSTWNSESEISRLNREPVGDHAVSAEFAEVLEIALQLATATAGAYDPTLQPELAKLGFTGASEDAPVEGDESAARVGVGFGQVRLQGSTASTRRLIRDEPRSLELSSVAKGWGVERLAAVLEAAGIDSYFVEIGGEVQARGTKPGELPWVVGVERPPATPTRALDGSGRAVHSTLDLRDRAIATSGSYRNFVRQGAEWTHHVLDARTLRNPDHAAVAVSVLAPGCALADGLATALLIVGPDGATDVLSQFGVVGDDVAALFLVAVRKPAAEDGAALTVEERAFGWPVTGQSQPR